MEKLHKKDCCSRYGLTQKFVRILDVYFLWGQVFLLVAMSGVSFSANAQQMTPDGIAQRAKVCTACHGQEGSMGNTAFFPRIAGKPAGYLYNQLLNFRAGRRDYPAMIYLVDHLSDAYLREFADYFANLKLPYPSSHGQNFPPAQLERGRQLVWSGDSSKNIPACVACHGEKLMGVNPATPALLGLPYDYLNAQFGAWRDHMRQATAPDCMAQIVARLDQNDINAVFAWLVSQNVPQDSAPAASLPVKPPLPCGSVPQ